MAKHCVPNTHKTLIARCHPVGLIAKLRPKGHAAFVNYYGLKGHTIVLPQDPGPLLNVLSSSDLRLKAPFQKVEHPCRFLAIFTDLFRFARHQSFKYLIYDVLCTAPKVLSWQLFTSETTGLGVCRTRHNNTLPL